MFGDFQGAFPRPAAAEHPAQGNGVLHVLEVHPPGVGIFLQ
jgi:hypothetical protein